MSDEGNDYTTTVRACPECDAAATRKRLGVRGSEYTTSEKEARKRGKKLLDGLYLCLVCDHTFDEPHYRPSRNVGGGVSGMARTLQQMDAADVPGLGGEDA